MSELTQQQVEGLRNTQEICLKDMADREKALEFLRESIETLSIRLGDDPDWRRVTRFLRRVDRSLMQRRDLNKLVLPLLSYKEYLETDHWQRIRKESLKLADYACQVCNTSNVELHVHHRSYDNLGGEFLADTIVLCKSCHELFHESKSLADSED